MLYHTMITGNTLQTFLWKKNIRNINMKKYKKNKSKWFI